MPDNVPIRPASGAVINAATDVLSDNSHSPKVTLLSGSGDPTPISPATSGKQDLQLAGQATIGTRAYGTALTRLPYTGTSAQSVAITATEVLVHNRGDGACYVKAGSNPTATVNDIPLEPGEKFHIRISSGHKIAAIQDSVGGYLNIIPVA